MTRWTSDPAGAARALIAGSLDELTPHPPLLWAGTAAVAPDDAAWQRRYGPHGAGTAEPPPGPFATALLRLPKSRAEQLMAVHQCLGVLAPDGRLIVYGGNDEGIRPFQKSLAELGEVVVRATRGHGRVLEIGRDTVRAPLKPRLADWRVAHPNTGGADWISYPGLFAGGTPDPGTTLLLAHLPPLAAGMQILDYGCGPGAIAAHIRHAQPTAVLTLLDNDSVALLAAAENVGQATLVAGDSLAATDRQRFALIVSNPPLHIGFKDDTGPLLRLIAEAPAHLTPDGVLLLVVQRRVALDRALAAAFATVRIVADDGRYRVWQATGAARKQGERCPQTGVSAARKPG